MTHTWYKLDTGRIFGGTDIHLPDIIARKKTSGYKEGAGLVDGVYKHTEYWVDGTTPTAKTANPSTIAGQTISNIPNPSTVDCGELGSYDVTDGTFEFTIDTAGEYGITVISVPHFDETFTVTIT